MEERYIADALGRTPATDPRLVLEVLHNPVRRITLTKT
jgi:hypothetical protein